MKNQIYISVNEMMSLLNELFIDGQTDLTIYIPFFEDKVYHIKLVPENSNWEGSAVNLLVDFRSYDQFVDSITDRYVAGQIPKFESLQALLVQSGIAEYPNFGQLMHRLQELCERDFLHGDRPVFIGLDTNLFRDRFYSVRIDYLKRLPRNKIGISISPYVKDELSFKDKYRNSHLKRLKQACKNPVYERGIEELFNQNCFYDRMRRLGFVEITKAKRIHWIELLPELEHNELEDSNDLNIINSYKKASNDGNVDILLLSKDHDFIAQAQGIAGIFPFLIESIKFAGNTFYVNNWNRICQFIYLAAITNGFIELKSTRESWLIFGIWRGKTSKDWEQERVLVMSSGQKGGTFQRVHRDIKILQDMSWTAERQDG